MSAVEKAFWLAIANVVVIALALTLEIPLRSAGLSVLIVAYGCWPAILLGYVLGKIADATSSQRTVARLAVLAVPACGLVVMLAALCHLLRFAPHACIPTFVAASILERTTRKPVLVPRAAVE